MNLSYLLFGFLPIWGLGIGLISILAFVIGCCWNRLPAQRVKRFLRQEHGVHKWQRWWGKPDIIRIWHLETKGNTEVHCSLGDFLVIQRAQKRVFCQVSPYRWVTEVRVHGGEDLDVLYFLKDENWKLDPEHSIQPAKGLAWIEDETGDCLRISIKESSYCREAIKKILDLVPHYSSAAEYKLKYSRQLIGEVLEGSRGISKAPVFKRLRMFVEDGDSAFLKTHIPGLPELPELQEKVSV